MDSKKKKHAIEMKIHRSNWTSEQKLKNKEQSKLRMKRYREKKRQEESFNANKVDDCIETRLFRQKKEDKLINQREYKRKWRENLTAQKKRRIREKDASQKREKRQQKLQNTKKALFPSQSTSIENTCTYQNKETYRKAVYRVKKKLPKTPERYAKLVKGLMTKVTPRKKAALNKEGIDSPNAKKNLHSMMEVLGKVEKALRGRTNIQKKRHKEYLGHISKYIKPSSQFQHFFSSSTGIKRKYLSDEYLTQKPRKIRKDAIQMQTTEKVKEIFCGASQAIPDKKSVNKKLEDKHVMNRSINSLWRQWNDENPEEKMSIGRFYKFRPKNVLTQKHRKLFSCLCEYCENV